MKKNIRFIIFSAAIVLVLGISLIIVLNIPESNEAGDKDTTRSDILLYDKTKLDPEEITIKNSGGEYVLIGYNFVEQASNVGLVSRFEKSSDSDSESKTESSTESSNKRVDKYNEEVTISMIYTMQGYDDMDLSKDMTDQLAYQCSYAAASMLVDKSGNKYAEYGLDNPVSTVTTVFSDDSEETLYIGNTAPDDQSVYVRWSGSKNVYLMPLESINMFLINKLQMFDNTISEEFNDEINDTDENSIVSLSISGTGYTKPIEICVGSDAMTTSQYAMQSPTREICALYTVQDVGESVYGLTGDEIVAAQISDEDIKKYGLDKPYMKITSKAADNSSVCILASEQDEEGNCYIMAERGKIICKAAVEDIDSWYDVQYTDFLAMTYIMPDMNKVSSLDISYKGTDTSFELEHKTEINNFFEEVLTTNVIHDGKKIDYSNLATFINNLSDITRKEMNLKNLDGYEEVASFRFTYEGDSGVTDTLIIYRNDKSRYAVTLNDNLEGTTDGEYAEKVLEQIDRIALDENLPDLAATGDSENYDEESAEEVTEETSDE